MDVCYKTNLAVGFFVVKYHNIKYLISDIYLYTLLHYNYYKLIMWIVLYLHNHAAHVMSRMCIFSHTKNENHDQEEETP